MAWVAESGYMRLRLPLQKGHAGKWARHPFQIGNNAAGLICEFVCKAFWLKGSFSSECNCHEAWGSDQRWKL